MVQAPLQQSDRLLADRSGGHQQGQVDLLGGQAGDHGRDHPVQDVHLGLLAEEVDPTSSELLGNYPQAFSHIGLINAAWAIAQAQRHRRPDEARRR